MVERRSIITSIEKQKHHASRFNIYLDGEYAFSVHEDVLVKYRLLKGREIDGDEMKEILQQEEENRAQQYALKYLSYRPRTRQELIQHLLHKGFTEGICRQAADWCSEHGYIDDERYAYQWVEERMRLRPRGRFLLKQELLQRGIPSLYVERAVRQIPIDSEEEAAFHLVEKKYIRQTFQEVDRDVEKVVKKAGAFLQRKGFTSDVIRRTLHRLRRALDEYDSEV